VEGGQGLAGVIVPRRPAGVDYGFVIQAFGSGESGLAQFIPRRQRSAPPDRQHLLHLLPTPHRSSANRFSIFSIAAAAAAVVLATAPAHAALGAGEGTPGYPHEMAAAAPATDRAEVRAEARRAVAEGRIASGEQTLTADAGVVQPLVATSRAAVRAEAAEAVRLGLVASGERALEYTQPQLAALRAAAERAERVIVAGQR